MRHRIVSWTAIAAILLSSLAPAITHAVTPKGSQLLFWQQVCSAQDGKKIAMDGADMESGQGESTQSAEHCTFCLFDLAHWAPPSQLGQQPANPHDSPPFTDQAAQSPPRLAWASPHSRAPPHRV